MDQDSFDTRRGGEQMSLKPEEAKSELLRVFKERKSQYASCLVSASVSNYMGNWGIYKFEAIFLDGATAKRFLPQTMTYPDFILSRMALSVPKGKELMGKLLEGGQVKIGGKTIEVISHDWEFYHWTSSECPPRLGWPCVVAELNVAKGGGSSVDGPLIRKNLPAYPTHHHAEKDWFVLEFHSGQHSIHRSFCVVFPDFRARLGEVTVGSSRISVEALPGTLRRNQVFGKYHVSLKKSVMKKDLEFKKGRAVIQTGAFPDEVHIYLLTRKDGERLDGISFGAGWYEIPRGVTIDFPSEQIRYLIDGGENERVEFKSLFNAERHGEFHESVAAFANGRGGTILVGVDDNCDILGVREEDLSSRISNSIYDRCEPNPEISFDLVEIEDREVLVVGVEEGENKPYLVDGIVYVRAGASDRRARRSELDQMYDSHRESGWP